MNDSKFPAPIRAKIYNVRQNDIPVNLLQGAYLVGGDKITPTLEPHANNAFNQTIKVNMLLNEAEEDDLIEVMSQQ